MSIVKLYVVGTLKNHLNETAFRETTTKALVKLNTKKNQSCTFIWRIAQSVCKATGLFAPVCNVYLHRKQQELQSNLCVICIAFEP